MTNDVLVFWMMNRMGRGMASAVLTQRNLWLSLSDIPDRYRAIYLDEPVSAMGLFAQSLYGIQAEVKLRVKEEANRSFAQHHCQA